MMCDQDNRLHNGAEPPELGDAVSEFAEVEPRLFRIAYRLRGSIGEAEDIVQEAWIRWQTCDRKAVRNTPAFLCSVTLRLSINAGKSAQARHETSITSLPERVDGSASPDLVAEQRESLQLAMWVILERLSPNERAAFLLREAFDYSYEQIADVIQQTNVSVRQQVSRARKRVADGRHSLVSATEHERLMQAFVVAARTGEMTSLEDILVNSLRSADGEPAARSHRPARIKMHEKGPSHGRGRNLGAPAVISQLSFQ